MSNVKPIRGQVVKPARSGAGWTPPPPSIMEVKKMAEDIITQLNQGGRR
jgi:hypothetical protein